MKTTVWIVFSASGNEIGRYQRKNIATAIAHEIGGSVSKYTKG